MLLIIEVGNPEKAEKAKNSTKRARSLDESDPNEPKGKKQKTDSKAEEQSLLKTLPSRARFALQILLNDEGKVAAMVAEGRPASPFSGTMGAHTTAWTVHLDHVRSRILDQSVSAAIMKVTDSLVRDARKMKNLITGKIEELDEKQTTTLKNADNALCGYVGVADKAAEYAEFAEREEDDAAYAGEALFLQEYVSALLSFVNSIPNATVDKANTGGHGEGETHPDLVRYEAALGGRNFATSPKQDSAPKNGGAVSDPTQENVQSAIKGLFDGKKSGLVWANHLRIVSRTYPKAFEKSGYKL